MVPLTMPMTRWMRSPASDSRSARISGMPPATEASNSRSTPARRPRPTARRRGSPAAPCWRVTTGLPLRSASSTRSRAGDMPPMTSTTTSMEGSSTTPTGVGGEQRLDAGDVAFLGGRTHGHLGQLELQACAVGDPFGVGQQEAGQAPPDVAAAQQADPHGRPCPSRVGVGCKSVWDHVRRLAWPGRLDLCLTVEGQQVVVGLAAHHDPPASRHRRTRPAGGAPCCSWTPSSGRRRR